MNEVSPLTVRDSVKDLLKKKSPLRGMSPSNEVPVFYWFLEDQLLEGEMTSDKILVDKDCQLPEGIFTSLPVDALVGSVCCMYFSKQEAFRALEIAIERFLKVWS